MGAFRKPPALCSCEGIYRLIGRKWEMQGDMPLGHHFEIFISSLFRRVPWRVNLSPNWKMSAQVGRGGGAAVPVI
jgi:hypothetical protein